MNRGSRFGAQTIIAIICVLVVTVGIVGLYMWMNTRIDYSTIDHIKELQKGPNNFADLSGDIQVASADDIGFKVEGEYDLTIYYGKQIIYVHPAGFNDADFREALGDIGIKIYHHVNDDGSILYRVTYWDEEVDEYALVQ